MNRWDGWFLGHRQRLPDIPSAAQVFPVRSVRALHDNSRQRDNAQISAARLSIVMLHCFQKNKRTKEVFEMTSQDRMFSASEMPDRDWWQILWPDPEGIVKTLGVRCGMEVVDLGCGSGYFTAALARQAGPGHVIAIDIVSEMLERARVACRAMTNCIWCRGDAMELGRLISDPVDFVLFANALHGVPDKPALAKQVWDILRPGGRMAIVNWHPIARELTVVRGKPRGPDTRLRLSPAQTCEAMEPPGFRLEAVVEFPPYHYGAIFARPEESVR